MDTATIPNLVTQTQNLLFSVLNNIIRSKDRIREKRKALQAAEKVVFQCRQELKRELMGLQRAEEHMRELEEELRVMEMV